MPRFAIRIALVALTLLVPQAGRAAAPVRPPRSVVLSDGWLFQPDPLDVGEAKGWWKPDFDRRGWRAVTVPMAWDFYEPVMDGYEGVGWYALPLPADHVARDAWQRLRFGRAHHRARVWIAGHEAGENLTGYLPFEVAATPFLTAAAPAWIVVRVDNAVRWDRLPGSSVVEWVQYGGLLEPVELLTTALAHVASVSLRAAPHGSDGRISGRVDLENASGAPFSGRVRLEVDDRGVEVPVRIGAKASAAVPLDLVLPKARTWSPESPTLYTARARLLGPQGADIDAVTDRFGVRSVETQGRSIRLNGHPLRIRGVNRYDELPGRGPVADETAIRADLEAVKAAGANLVRTHYPQSPAHLRIADEIGLLWMEEVPLNWWRASFRPPPPPEFQNDRIVDLAEKALAEMVRRDGNHPSLIVWSMANECETTDDLGVRAMERLLARAKTLDPTRLATYVADRGVAKNRAFARADLVAINLYFGMWAGEVAEDLGQIETRVFGPTRDALAEAARGFPEKPILVSEFGTIGIAGSGGDTRFSEDYQAAYVSAVWRAIRAVPEASGGIVWSWADYRHRTGFQNDFPADFGPFGLVTLDRRPKKALDALRTLWATPDGAR